MKAAGARSTMATSTRASASSAANMSPVGPPPAITTACSVTIPFWPSVWVMVRDTAARLTACGKPVPPL
jgi:hypothetical protein